MVNPRYLYWATVLMLSLAGMGLAIRELALRDVPLGETLIIRGLVCLAAVIVFARRRRLSLLPRSPGVQARRALIAGLALTFFSLSYNWLTASAVAVLSNIDVPLLLVLAPMLGNRVAGRARLLALVSILFLIWYITGLERQPDLALGLGALAIGSILLCFGYWFIQKSMSDENEAITVLVPSLAIVGFGWVEMLFHGGQGSAWTSGTLALGGLSGLGMFAAYVATMRLYQLTDLATAEFPTLLASIVIQPLERIFLDVPMRSTYLLSSIGFTVVVFLTLRWQRAGGGTHAY